MLAVNHLAPYLLLRLLAERIGTGRFFVARKEVITARHTTDGVRCDRLWEESARLCGVGDTLSGKSLRSADVDEDRSREQARNL
jgi:hypothetical protein